MYPLDVSSGSCDEHDKDTSNDAELNDAELNDAESSRDDIVQVDVSANDTLADQVTPSRLCERRWAATEALRRMSEWTSVPAGPWRM